MAFVIFKPVEAVENFKMMLLSLLSSDPIAYIRGSLNARSAKDGHQEKKTEEKRDTTGKSDQKSEDNARS